MNVDMGGEQVTRSRNQASCSHAVFRPLHTSQMNLKQDYGTQSSTVLRTDRSVPGTPGFVAHTNVSCEERNAVREQRPIAPFNTVPCWDQNQAGSEFPSRCSILYCSTVTADFQLLPRAAPGVPTTTRPRPKQRIHF